MQGAGGKFHSTAQEAAARKQWIQDFLEELQGNKLVRSIEFFISFLSVTGRSSFKQLKKDVARVESPYSVFETRNLKGRAEVEVTGEKVSAAENVHAFAANCQGLYAELEKAHENTVEAFGNLADALRKEAALYKEFSRCYLGMRVRVLPSCRLQA